MRGPTLEESILAFIRTYPGCTCRQIDKAHPKNTRTANTLARLCEEGVIERRKELVDDPTRRYDYNREVYVYRLRE